MNLPEYKDIRIRETQKALHPTGNGTARCGHEVLDVLRQRFVALTPEEWVRQHFVNFLIKEKHFPQALMANEVELRVGDKKLRCDSVLFGRDRQPKVIMEYKAESVPITPKVLTQIATYNMLLHVAYLIVSNGNTHVCLWYNREQGKWEVLPDIPDYNDIVQSMTHKP